MARRAFPATIPSAPSGGSPIDRKTPESAAAEPVAVGDSERLDPSTGPLDQLFRVQAPKLLRYVSRWAGGRGEADDVVQESFLRLVRHTVEQDLPERPEAYLQRIARNLLLNRAKQALVRGEHLHAPHDEETLASREPGPYGVLAFRELTERYEKALNALSPKTRHVFLRHRRDGYTYVEIAEELNQTVSNVEKHMMKAIAHLDRVLGRF